MTRQEFCRQCIHKNSCSEIYRVLGSKRGPSVLSRVLSAFLLPAAMFIASVAASMHVIAKFIHSPEIQNALAFLLAVAATLLFVPAFKLITAKLKKPHSPDRL